MQCRLPRKNVPNKKSIWTWYLNETISWSDAATYHANFTCNGVYYDAIRLTHNTTPTGSWYIDYHKYGLKTWDHAAKLSRKTQIPHFSWVKEFYRTITFDAPPTGDLLTWLEANATPQ